MSSSVSPRTTVFREQKMAIVISEKRAFGCSFVPWGGPIRSDTSRPPVSRGCRMTSATYIRKSPHVAFPARNQPDSDYLDV